MKRNILALFAMALAVTLFAFTPPAEKSNRTDLVWFQVNSSGVIQNPSTGKLMSEPPELYDCEGLPQQLCAFGYDISRTTDLGGGNYQIDPETVDFDHQSDFEEEAFKEF